MAPKFRGDSEDWLDDEVASVSTRAAAKAAKTKGGRGEASLPPEQANATIAEVFPRVCVARLDEGRDALCTYRRAQVLAKPGYGATRERAPVAVGDRVRVEAPPGTSGEGVVEAVCARKNRLARPAPARANIVHVLASNVDVVAIVAAAKKPDFSPGLVDRFLIAARIERIPAVLCVNKVDVLEEGSPRPWDLYRDLGVDVVEASAKKQVGIEDLRERFAGRSVVFCGHSGVGKTSLLRALTGLADLGRVGEVSDVTGKGLHTTTGAVLLRGPSGSRWIDTPGVREFGLMGLEAAGLAAHFPEFARLDCEAPGCSHTGEEGCRATELTRYESYRRIFDSLAAGDH